MLEGFRFLSITDVPPKEVKEGITAKILKEGTAEDPSVFMELTFAPGAAFGRDEHDELEILHVLEGEFSDGDAVHGPGTVIIGHPGSVHFPASSSGCRVLAFHPQG
jgi:anti-sigma factor ChrR (cupin superfamily)